MSGGSILGLEVQRKGSRQKSGQEVLGGAGEGGREDWEKRRVGESCWWNFSKSGERRQPHVLVFGTIKQDSNL